MQDTPLHRYTLAARHVIVESKQLKTLVKMLSTRLGALHAVQTIMAIVDKAKPIPPAIAPKLAVNIFVVLVGSAERMTGHKADPASMHQTINFIAQEIGKSHPEQAPAQPSGLIAGAMQ